MFCANCGKELHKNDFYCTYCGERIEEDNFDALIPAEGGNKTKKKLWIVVAGLLAAVALVVVPVLSLNKGIGLKYSWGMAPSGFEKGETFLKENKTLFAIEDLNHEVDAIEEFEIIDNKVVYLFEEDQGLFQIKYSFSYKGTKLDVLEEYYGDCVTIASDKYGWWIDDTVIIYDRYGDDGRITYYCEEYVLKELPGYASAFER